MVEGNQHKEVTGFLCEDTFLFTVSDDWAEEELGSCKVDVM
jgi:hypothetical protein